MIGLTPASWAVPQRAAPRLTPGSVRCGRRSGGTEPGSAGLAKEAPGAAGNPDELRGWSQAQAHLLVNPFPPKS